MKIEVYGLIDVPTSRLNRTGPFVLQVPPEERLSEVLANVREEPTFSPVPWEHWRVWLCDRSGVFYRDFGVPWCLMSDGLLRWRPDIEEVTLADLERTAQANLLNVKRDVLHFWLMEGLGDGEEEILRLWKIFQVWLSIAADIGGVGALVWALLQVVRRKWKSWRGRNATLNGFIDSVLSRKSDGWNLRQFSAIYELEEGEGRTVLRLFGFRESEQKSGSFVFCPDKAKSRVIARLEKLNGEPFGVYQSDVSEEESSQHGDQKPTAGKDDSYD